MLTFVNLMFFQKAIFGEKNTLYKHEVYYTHKGDIYNG